MLVLLSQKITSRFYLKKSKLKILSKEKQANGEYCIKYNKETGLYEIFNVPILIIDTLNFNALLVDFKNAYKLLISPTVDLRDFSQDYQATLQGADGISLSLYFDGGIKNTNAVKKLA